MRIRTITAFGVGYVLGARAGRGRYEQLKRWFDRATSSSAAGTFKENAGSLISSGVETARGTAANGAAAAAARVRKLAG